jgi:hypothetical protein
MLIDHLEKQLAPEGVSLDELRELLVRLLNYGVLSRDESQTERELFDRLLRIEAPVRELLDLFGIALHIDRRFDYLRLLPPGTTVPGMEEASHHAFTGSLRARLTQNEVALLLVLRMQYDQALREGKVDENGFVADSFEAIGIAMKNLLGRSLPEKSGERKRLFTRLRQLRLIDFNQDEEFESGESWLRIHPMIVDFVSSEAVAALHEGSVDQETVDGEESDVS